MILGFSKNLPNGKPSNFEAKILIGEKIHTIRLDPNNRWKPGMRIQMATGVRTKNYRQFNKHRDDLQTCLGVQEFEITRVPGQPPAIFIDGKLLPGDQHLALARRDGFDALVDFYEFFLRHKGEPVRHYAGRIIHWTDHKYLGR